MKAWKNSKCSINSGELLVITRTCSPQTTNNTQETITFYSVTSSTQKILPLDCEGQFTTNPKYLHLYLPEYMEHVSNLFPSEVCIYTQRADPKEHMQGIPQHFITSVITLIRSSTETTLVASPAIPQFSNTIMEIPVDIPEVKIVVIESSDRNETQELYENSRHILENYNPKNVQSMKDASTEEDYNIQSLLYSGIREGYETNGIQSDYDYVCSKKRSDLCRSTMNPEQKLTIQSTLPRPLPRIPTSSPSLLSSPIRNEDKEGVPLSGSHKNEWNDLPDLTNGDVASVLTPQTHENVPDATMYYTRMESAQNHENVPDATMYYTRMESAQTHENVPDAAMYYTRMESAQMHTESVPDYRALKKKIEELHGIIQTMQKEVARIDGIECQIKNLSLMLKNVQAVIGAEPDDESFIAEQNRQFVSKMTFSEVRKISAF